MNTFALLTIMPATLTLGSIAILYFSFKNRFDASGRFFLFAELMWLFILALLFITNVYPSTARSEIFFLHNSMLVLSELAILYSIKSLTQKIELRSFLYWGAALIVFCGLIEYCRHYVDPSLPIFLLGASSLTLTLMTYRICKNTNSNGLELNLFIRWIGYSEVALSVIHFLRLASYFSGTPMSPRDPTNAHIIVFMLFAAVNLFRYYTYQSLRVSWVDPRSIESNPLNQHLVALIREKNQFLQGLSASNRALGISALANSLAHQISQPITGILLQMESVKRSLISLGGQENSVKALDSINDQLNKLSSLVANLRKLVGRSEAEIQLFRISDTFDEVLELMKPSLKAKNITLEKQAKTNPTVKGNSVQIQQVFINVLNNAIDAIDAIDASSSESRTISVIIDNDELDGIILIQDSGIGISPEISLKLFELYESTKADGLGIGLWLSREILKQYKGSISVNNLANQGAVAEIRIPIAQLDQETNA